MSVTMTQLTNWLGEFRRLVHASRDELTELDSAIGDADHGTNMDRGTSAMMSAISLDSVAASGKSIDTVADLFKLTGVTLVSTVGGAAGPLYGTFFLRFAATAGANAELEPTQFAAAMRSGVEGVVARGKPQAGDKTMFDALDPAVEALNAALADGAELADALAKSAAAANAGRDATIPMLARKGRASYLGERSIGHQDPGATSAALLIQAAATTLG